MRHELLIYSGLLAIGLGASYWASLPEVKEDEGSQSLFNVAATNVAEIKYDFDGQTVHLAKLPDSNRFWISTTKPGKSPDKHPKPDAATAPDPKAAAEPAASLPPVVEEFVAGDGIDKLLEFFAPFEALRSLGKIPADRLAEFGLKGETGHFSLQSKESDKKFQFAVGGKSYGSRNVFIMNTETSEVFLAKQDPFDQLRNANSRLFERKLTNAVPEEVEGATVTALAKTKTLTHTKRDETGQLLWGDSGADGKAKPSYKNWMEKLEKLRVLSFANKEQIAALELLQPLLEVKYQSRGKTVDTIAIKKMSEKIADKPDPTTSYWARSEFLSSWVKVSQSRLDSLEKDLPAMME